jgi:serine phosphatase RsbU (regulator of sigma subunit)
LLAQECDTNNINKLCIESQKNLSKDLDKAYDLAKQAYAIGKQCPNTKHHYKSVLILSSVYYQYDYADSIIQLLTPIVNNLPKDVSTNYKGKLYHKLGSGFSMKLQFKNALYYTLEALKCFEQTKDTTSIINSLVNISNIYSQQYNFNQSEKQIRKAENIAIKHRDKATLGNVYNTMGIIYAENNSLDSAEKFFLLSTKFREELHDNTSVVWNYNNLGGLYLMQKKTKEGTIYLEKALKKFEELKNFEGQTSVANNLAEAYMQLENPKKALEYYSYSRVLYQITKNPENLENLYTNLSNYYDITGDLKTAFKYSDSLIVLKDSIYGKRLDESMAEMQTKFDVEKKDLELAKNKAEFEIEKNKRYITYGALAFFVLLFSIAIWAFIQKRKNGRLLETKNNLLENANQEISHQKEQLSEKQKEIVDSINYAKKIQTALLASEEMLLENLINHFILFKPKDIVSGDFTWATKKDDLFYLACCDSTGHGVPGAFMSLLNIGFLSEAIKERNITSPGKIFDYVRDRLIDTIGKDKQNDGFDGTLLCIDLKNNLVTYAAANNSPMLVRNNELQHLSCNKMPVGKGIKTDSFDTFTLNFLKNDSLYLYTDGYPDQFGGPKGKKFKYKQLEELLLKNSSLSLTLQNEKLNTVFEEWQGNLEQVDDVCIVGITF